MTDWVTYAFEKVHKDSRMACARLMIPLNVLNAAFSYKGTILTFDEVRRRIKDECPPARIVQEIIETAASRAGTDEKKLREALNAI